MLVSVAVAPISNNDSICLEHTAARCKCGVENRNIVKYDETANGEKKKRNIIVHRTQTRKFHVKERRHRKWTTTYL